MAPLQAPPKHPQLSSPYASISQSFHSSCPSGGRVLHRARILAKLGLAQDIYPVNGRHQVEDRAPPLHYFLTRCCAFSNYLMYEIKVITVLLKLFEFTCIRA